MIRLLQAWHSVSQQTETIKLLITGAKTHQNWRPMVMRAGSFFPFQATYYLNGHSFIEQELTRAHVGFRKNDNAFLAINDVAALQAAADRLSPDIIRKRLDYWTLNQLDPLHHRGTSEPVASAPVRGSPARRPSRRRLDRQANSSGADHEARPIAASAALAVYRSIRELLRDGPGSSAIVSLPTGAGKTRVAIEAICDHLTNEPEVCARRPFVLWIAQSEELLRQAWDSFRQVWPLPPGTMSADGATVRRRRPGALNLVRAWGGRVLEDLELGDGPTVLMASIQQLHAWVRKKKPLQAVFPPSKITAAVIDEAHRVLNEQHSAVLRALDLRDKRRWQPLSSSPPVIGLTATPRRRIVDENRSLRSYFQKNLIAPNRLGRHPIRSLAKRQILSLVSSERLESSKTPTMTTREFDRYSKFKDLPQEYLERLGLSAKRNALILTRLVRVPRTHRILVFACSVTHAETLALGVNRMLGEELAAHITGDTPHVERVAAIDRFRKGQLIYLCNVGVLTTGFDAPATDVVCITRPTTSAVLYEQMVGRGLRGPLNGGTKDCLVIDVQDKGLPREILSYERVIEDWR